MSNKKESKKNKREVMICLRVTDEEKAKIETMAREDDRSVNDYIRHKILGAKKYL